MKGRLSAAAPGKGRTWTASLDVRSETLRLRGIAAERVRGTVEIKEGVARYRLQGSALGGTFEIDGTHPRSPRRRPRRGPAGPHSRRRRPAGAVSPCRGPGSATWSGRSA